MKYCDKYPAPDGDDPCVPPSSRIFGLHPLVWVFIVVMGIAVFAAIDHLEDADWDRLPIFDQNQIDDSEYEDEHADEDQDEDPGVNSSTTSTGQ